ncbi:MAG: hypothetical protein A3J35_03890 [Gammaproteobacteria bacterium RIFCSPLOWO2_02_FULL_52_10]|nr:MAG: hypothetical protein A3J35_03890 [Gammaproteobacteria bacterium RIFCSPLOWO2_02_FULL_52_10]
MAGDIPADKVTPPFVKLSFDVTRDGRARNIKVVEESEPKSYGVHKTAKQLIKSSIFRPRLLDGELVETKSTELLLYGSVLQSNYTQDNSFSSAFKIRR